MSRETVNIGFVGDVHANIRALTEALRVLDARKPDKLVFMGDLLSYGGDVTEVLEKVSERAARGAVVILGNHDRLYLDLIAGRQSYYEGLPDWIRESVDFTLKKIDRKVLTAIPFTHEHLQGEMLVAHANPFGADERGTPSWRYVRSAQDHEDAGQALRERNLRIGVFGHTHRARIVQWPRPFDPSEERLTLQNWTPSRDSEALLVNVGSVGQPRNTTATSMVGFMSYGPSVSIDIQPLVYDVQGHMASLQKLPLSPRAIGALQAFFVPLAA